MRSSSPRPGLPPRARARAACRPISFRTAAGRCAIVRCRFAAVRAFLMFQFWPRQSASASPPPSPPRPYTASIPRTKASEAGSPALARGFAGNQIGYMQRGGERLMTMGTTTPTRNASGYRAHARWSGHDGDRRLDALVRSVLGTNLSWRGLLFHGAFGHANTFVEGVGFVFIVLALLGIVGLCSTGPAGSDDSRASSGSRASFYRDPAVTASGQNIEGLDTRIEIGAWLALTGH